MLPSSHPHERLRFHLLLSLLLLAPLLLLLPSLPSTNVTAYPLFGLGASKPAVASTSASAAGKKGKGSEHQVCEMCGTVQSFNVSSCYTVECSPSITTLVEAPFAPMIPSKSSPAGTTYVTSSILAADPTDAESVKILTRMLLDWVNIYAHGVNKEPKTNIVVTDNVLASFKQAFNAQPKHIYSIEDSVILPLKCIPEKAERRTLRLVFPENKSVTLPIHILVKKGLISKTAESVKGTFTKDPDPSAPVEPSPESEMPEKPEKTEAKTKKEAVPATAAVAASPPADLAALLALLQGSAVANTTAAASLPPPPPPPPSATPDVAALLSLLSQNAASVPAVPATPPAPVAAATPPATAPTPTQPDVSALLALLSAPQPGSLAA